MELHSSNLVDPQIAKDALVGSIAELVDVDRKLVELTKFTVRDASASLRMASRRLSQDPNVLAEYRITLPEERPDGVTGETIKAALEKQNAAVRLTELLGKTDFAATVAFLSAPKVEYVRRQPPGQSGAVSAAVIGASLGGAVVFLGLVAVVSHSAWRRSKARSGGAREAACRGAAASGDGAPLAASEAPDVAAGSPEAPDAAGAAPGAAAAAPDAEPAVAAPLVSLGGPRQDEEVHRVIHRVAL